MKQKMRRLDRQLNEEQIEHILCLQTYGILSTVGEDGFPYGVPVNYVFTRQFIYFHCAKDVGHKLKNINHHNKVCFTIVGQNKTLPSQFATAYESVIIFGHVSKVDQPEKIANMFIQRFSPEFIKEGHAYIQKMIDQTSFYQISIDQITGKARV